MNLPIEVIGISAIVGFFILFSFWKVVSLFFLKRKYDPLKDKAKLAEDKRKIMQEADKKELEDKLELAREEARKEEEEKLADEKIEEDMKRIAKEKSAQLKEWDRIEKEYEKRKIKARDKTKKA